MEFKKEYLEWSIVDRLEELEVVCYEDGLLGSSSGKYYGELDYKDIKSEDDLEYIVYSEDDGDFDDIDFDEWFNDCDEFEIEDNGNGGDYGHYKVVLDKENKSIKIMIIPCIYHRKKSNEIRIFGFDWKNGELVREINNEKVEELLSKNEMLFCG